jgi:hydroxymethylbilane synthase
VTAERAALAGLGGGCQVPIGVHCFAGDEGYSVVSAVAAPDGSEVLRVVMDRQSGLEAEALGRKVAEELLRQGAQRLLSVGAAESPGSAPVGAA